MATPEKRKTQIDVDDRISAPPAPKKKKRVKFDYDSEREHDRRAKAIIAKFAAHHAKAMAKLDEDGLQSDPILHELEGECALRMTALRDVDYEDFQGGMESILAEAIEKALTDHAENYDLIGPYHDWNQAADCKY